MISVRISGSLLLGIAVTITGCGQLQYKGTEPTARSAHEDPGLQDVYMGADMQFAVTDKAEQRRLEKAPGEKAPEPIDPWGRPVDLDSPFERQTEQAEAPLGEAAVQSDEMPLDQEPAEQPEPEQSDQPAVEGDGEAADPLEPENDKGSDGYGD